MQSENAYLGVGSNRGDREFYLRAARALLEKLPGTRFLRASSIQETDPVGEGLQGKFLNAVWEIETTLSPRELKDRVLEIESGLGRRRTGASGSREIDLDILFYGDHIVEEEHLRIPHPRLHERPFVLVPLSELAPEMIHPKLKKTVRELLTEIESPLR